MSDRKAKELGLKPLARVLTSAAAGVEPRVMGLGPIHATRKALARAGLTLDRIGLIELNEDPRFRYVMLFKNNGVISLQIYSYLCSHFNSE